MGDMYPVGPSFMCKHMSNHFYRHIKPEDVHEGGRLSTTGAALESLEPVQAWQLSRANFDVHPEYSQYRMPPRFYDTLDSTSARSHGSNKFQPPARRSPTASSATTDSGHGRVAGHSRVSDLARYEPHAKTVDKGWSLQSKLMRAKRNHRTELKHNDRWDRIPCGSRGHSEGGSEFGSIANVTTSRSATNSKAKPRPSGNTPVGSVTSSRRDGNGGGRGSDGGSKSDGGRRR